MILLSVWVESRYPSRNPKAVLLPAAQETVTRPIVDTLSREISRHVEGRVRQRIEDRLTVAGLTLAETIDRFLDPTTDLEQRRLFAYRLARVGSPECADALLKVLPTAALEHKAFMAQFIGSTGNPRVKEWLWPLLADPDEGVRVAALRGLSALGGDDVTTCLAGCLDDPAQPRRIRLEAAIGLGTAGTADARDRLTQSLARESSRSLAVEILNSLGRFEFPAVAGTFAGYLATPSTPADRRVVAMEALAGSSSEAATFLVGVAARDADPDVRAAAAWAISSHETVTDLGATLAGLVGREPEADVRRRLYEALTIQEEIPLDALVPQVQAEHDQGARVAGLNAVGSALRRQPASAWTATFDRELVPELARIASQPNTINLRMRAVFALRRAGTPGAVAGAGGTLPRFPAANCHRRPPRPSRPRRLKTIHHDCLRRPVHLRPPAGRRVHHLRRRPRAAG